MQVVESITALQEIIQTARRSGKTVGFVPTMGYLHEGHLSLMRRAKTENDLVVASIFVNPAQFGPNEDLDTYPRDLEQDKDRMLREKVDVAYLPTVEQIYPEGYTTFVEVKGPMTKALCGLSRPRFFKGVTTVVAKLFNIVAPDRAYFGQKDAQQSIIIQQMVRDLNFNIDIVVCPTVRETDGLAMSSRNAYLSPRHRADAVILSQSLNEARQMFEAGERQAEVLYRHIRKRIEQVQDAVIDYIAVADAATLADLQTIDRKALIALAVKIGETRLIDNMLIS